MLSAYGENDLDVNYNQNRESDHTLVYLRQNTISKLVEHICSFVEYLLVGVGVGKVIVGQLLRGQPWAIKSPTFNDDVITINIKIEEHLNKIEGAYFWHNRGFWDSFDFLGRDGVHILNYRSDRWQMDTSGGLGQLYFLKYYWLFGLLYATFFASKQKYC